MKKYTMVLAAIILFVSGVASGWVMHVNFVSKPAFEYLALGMTDSMHESSLFLIGLHNGRTEIFKKIFVRNIKGGLELIPSIEPYLESEHGKETIKKRRALAKSVLWCEDNDWPSPKCDEI